MLRRYLIIAAISALAFFLTYAAFGFAGRGRVSSLPTLSPVSPASAPPATAPPDLPPPGYPPLLPVLTQGPVEPLSPIRAPTATTTSSP